MGIGLGFSQGWTELRVLGLVCLVLLLLALVWVLGRTSYEVDFDLHRQRVVAGETASGRVVIRNRGRRALFTTRIERNLGKGGAPLLLTSLPRHEEQQQPQ